MRARLQRTIRLAGYTSEQQGSAWLISVAQADWRLFLWDEARVRERAFAYLGLQRYSQTTDRRQYLHADREISLPIAPSLSNPGYCVFVRARSPRSDHVPGDKEDGEGRAEWLKAAWALIVNVLY